MYAFIGGCVEVLFEDVCLRLCLGWWFGGRWLIAVTQ